MLLRVLGPAPGVCLVLGPVFPEVAHRGPSLIWSGGAYPIRELLTPLFFVLVCACVHVCVCVCARTYMHVHAYVCADFVFSLHVFATCTCLGVSWSEYY